MNALVYHIASGQAFFSGVMLIELATILAFRPSGRWLGFCRTVLACLGLMLIAASATPLPGVFYAVAGTVTVVWIGVEGTSGAVFRRARPWLWGAVLAVWLLGVMFELPYHWQPDMPRMGRPTIYVVGDSISAGMGNEAETWPGLLAREHGLKVVNFAQMGATVASARGQAERVADPSALVIAEIGGNDVLGATTPDAFERALDTLLARLRSGDRTVVLLELPLPPSFNAYGNAQRRSAARHGALLVPKRVLLGVLTRSNATLDSIHLSRSGHAHMAETIWEVIRPAFGR